MRERQVCGVHKLDDDKLVVARAFMLPTVWIFNILCMKICPYFTHFFNMLPKNKFCINNFS